MEETLGKARIKRDGKQRTIEETIDIQDPGMRTDVDQTTMDELSIVCHF